MAISIIILNNYFKHKWAKFDHQAVVFWPNITFYLAIPYSLILEFTIIQREALRQGMKFKETMLNILSPKYIGRNNRNNDR